jgi:hypothetical protein
MFVSFTFNASSVHLPDCFPSGLIEMLYTFVFTTFIYIWHIVLTAVSQQYQEKSSSDVVSFPTRNPCPSSSSLLLLKIVFYLQILVSLINFFLFRVLFFCILLLCSLFYCLFAISYSAVVKHVNKWIELLLSSHYTSNYCIIILLKKVVNH